MAVILYKKVNKEWISTKVEPARVKSNLDGGWQLNKKSKRKPKAVTPDGA